MRIMKGTIADDLVQRGVKKGRKLGEKEGRKLGEKEGGLRAKRDDLIRLLRSRFRRVPRAAQQAIRETRDVRRLDRWFERALEVDSLDDVGLR